MTGHEQAAARGMCDTCRLPVGDLCKVANRARAAGALHPWGLLQRLCRPAQMRRVAAFGGHKLNNMLRIYYCYLSIDL